MDSDNSSGEVTAALRQYGWLRDEINQSNRLQNRVIFAQAILVGIGFGIKGSETITGNGELAGLIGLGVGFLPLLVVTSTGVWLLEQARVMRAGNYLHHLEFYINQQLETNPVAWESWLRGDWEGPNIDSDTSIPKKVRGSLSDPQYVYNGTFIIGYPFYFVILYVASWLLVYQLDSAIPLNKTHILVMGAVFFTFSLIMAYASFRQIRHENHDQSDSMSDYIRFLNQTFDKEPASIPVESLFSQHRQEIEKLPLEADTVHEQFGEIVELAKDNRES